MNALSSVKQPLQHKWLTDASFVKKFTCTAIGVGLLAMTSQLSIPLQPVPLTFQSATVMLIGLTCGARLGSLIVFYYLLAGMMGLPVFSNFSSGILCLSGPTGGYLLGFLPAVAITGYLSEKGFGRHPLLSFLAALIGTSLIFLCGVTGLTRFMTWHQALMVGVMPFIISEPVKLLCVASFVPRCWKKRDA